MVLTFTIVSFLFVWLARLRVYPWRSVFLVFSLNFLWAVWGFFSVSSCGMFWVCIIDSQIEERAIERKEEKRDEED